MEGHDERSSGAVRDEAADRHTANTHTIFHDWTGDAPLHYSVVAGVAAVTNTEPEALPALYEVIDPDCLDQLFESASRDQGPALAVSFSFAGCAVRVTGSGEVTVRPSEPVASD